MKYRNLFHGIAAVLAAITVRLVFSELLSYFFLPVQRWYFHRYVESVDPDPPFLPLGWMPELLFPFFCSVVGGCVAVFIYRSKSASVSAIVGLTIFLGYVAWWRKAFLFYVEADRMGLVRNSALALLYGTGAFLACYMTQRSLEKRRTAEANG